jgi:hypothetical protein
MGKLTDTPKLHNLQDATYSVGKPSTDQFERLIAIRLRTATNLAIDPDASIAWKERKVIRDRMRYYTSAHHKVLN